MDTPTNTLKIPIDVGSLHITVRPLESSTAVIYFGGKGEDVSLRLADFSGAFPEAALYFMHYRGYGQSAGVPSELTIMQDAVALFDKVAAKHQKIILMGRSLGTGVALHLASLRSAVKLVLITPYNSIEDVAMLRYPYFPIHYMLWDKYESWRYAPQITIPTLMLVAEWDKVIPRANTEKLYSQFKNGIASYKVLANTNHNSISHSAEYLLLLQEFLNH